MIVSTSQKFNNSFGSRNIPIMPFEIKTPKGKLFVQEMSLGDFKNNGDFQELSKFFIDNFIDGSTDPGWKWYLNPKHESGYKNRIKRFSIFCKELFKNDDGNTTFLVAKDKQNKIKAGAISCTCDELPPFVNNSNIFYLDSLAVDKKYRNNGVGKTLLEKTLTTSKGYTDAVLTGYNKAVPLYKKLGFKNLQEIGFQNKDVKKIWDIVREDRDDIPRHTQLMTKVLDEKASRWWEI